MKKFGLKILISAIIMSTIIGRVFALESDNGDCAIILSTGGNFEWLNSWDGDNEKVYPKESIKRAMLNLKAFCCQANTPGSETPTCKYDKDNGLLLEQYPDSQFLFDHLVDIGLRRLDAMSELLYEDVDADIIGKQWREFIIQKAQQKDGTTPTDINPEFKRNRTLNQNYILEYRRDGNYATEYQSGRESKVKDYDNRPLINRYQNICEVVSYIYGKSPGELNNYIKTYGYSNCENLIKDTTSRNILYTKVIMLKKSNKLLYDNADSYIKTYFAKSRLQKLKETVLAILQAFSTVNKQVIKLVQECS